MVNAKNVIGAGAPGKHKSGARMNTENSGLENICCKTGWRSGRREKQFASKEMFKENVLGLRRRNILKVAALSASVWHPSFSVIAS